MTTEILIPTIVLGHGGIKISASVSGGEAPAGRLVFSVLDEPAEVGAVALELPATPVFAIRVESVAAGRVLLEKVAQLLDGMVERVPAVSP